MIKKTATRICMCCGERKELPVNQSYCKECSTPPVSLMTGPSQSKLIGLCNIKPLR